MCKLNSEYMINIKNKKCNKCNLLLNPSNFFIKKNGIKNGKQQYTLSASCKSCNEKNNNFKTCNMCNNKLPKNEKYFPTKIVKQKLKNGAIAKYNSFRPYCWECNKKYYSNFSKERYKNHKIKEKENKRSKIWRENNPEKAKELTLNWRNKNKKKLLERDRKRVRELEDSWVASTIKISLKNIPKEVLQLTKLIIQAKRELKKIKQ